MGWATTSQAGAAAVVVRAAVVVVIGAVVVVVLGLVVVVVVGVVEEVVEASTLVVVEGGSGTIVVEAPAPWHAAHSETARARPRHLGLGFRLIGSGTEARHGVKIRLWGIPRPNPDPM
jgi:hypothetical protein